MKAAVRPVKPAKGPVDCPRGPGLWSAAPWRGTGPDTAPGRIQTAARAVTARAHLMTPRAAPAGAFGWPEVPFFTSSSDQRERSRAVAEGALQWGAGWGKAGPRQAAGRGSNQQPKKIEGAPFRALPLLLNKGRPVWVGQVLCWPSAPALVGSGGRQACSIAGSD